MRKYIYTVNNSFEGKNVKSLLRHMGCSAEIIKELKKGGLLINGKSAFVVQILKEDDQVEILFPDEDPNIEAAFCDQVKILYSDEDIAIAEKPPFLPMHQSPGHYGDTLANHFAAVFPQCKFRAVDRLDKNTSGLCVVALNKLSAAILCKNKPKKLYYAAVKGDLSDIDKKDLWEKIHNNPLHGNWEHIRCSGTLLKKEGRIDLPIGREENSLIKRQVCENGQRAVTNYRVIREKGDIKLLEISLETGRTHQIRVHMAYLGFPLLGDELYGGDCGLINRQALHCGKIRLIHPITKEELTFASPLPLDMDNLFI